MPEYQKTKAQEEIRQLAKKTKEDDGFREIYCWEEIQQERKDLEKFKNGHDTAKYTGSNREDKTDAENNLVSDNISAINEEVTTSTNQSIMDEEFNEKNEGQIENSEQTDAETKTETFNTTASPWSWRCINKIKKFTMTGRIKEDLDNDRNTKKDREKHLKGETKSPKRLHQLSSFRKRKFVERKPKKFGRKRASAKSLRKKIFQKKEEALRNKIKVLIFFGTHYIILSVHL